MCTETAQGKDWEDGWGLLQSSYFIAHTSNEIWTWVYDRCGKVEYETFINIEELGGLHSEWARNGNSPPARG